MAAEEWRHRVSQPRYAVKAERDLRIRMRDGVHLGADLYAPDAPGEFPVLLSLSPYGKDVQKLPVPPFPTDSRLGNGGIESGNSEFFAERGYAHLIVDCRGTASSEGTYSFLDSHEYRDGHDVIEWAAQQPWCDGNVGMLGTSYFSMIQYGIAATRPPHLRAICAIDALTDLYRHWAYHGGVLSIGFIVHWWAIALAHTVREPLSDAETDERVKTLVEHPDIKAYPTAYIALVNRMKNPHLRHILLHPTDGPYYKGRSPRLEEIAVPTYIIGRWTAWGLHLPGAFEAFDRIRAPRKLEVLVPESGAGFTRPWLKECHETVLRWYDHWLKGIDTGIMEEPPVRLHVQGTGSFRYSTGWPLPGTEWQALYLREGGRLLSEPPGTRGESGSFVNDPGLQRGEPVPAVTYATEPRDDDLEITGPLALNLFASLDSPDTNWIVELRSLAPAGSSLITIGWLKASHREVDKARSRPWRPFHSHTYPAPVVPGEVVRYAIELRETSFVVPRGHRLQLVIKGQDAPWEGSGYHRELFTHLPNSARVHHVVHHSSEYPSHLLLPVVEATA